MFIIDRNRSDFRDFAATELTMFASLDSLGGTTRDSKEEVSEETPGEELRYWRNVQDKSTKNTSPSRESDQAFLYAARVPKYQS